MHLGKVVYVTQGERYLKLRNDKNHLMGQNLNRGSSQLGLSKKKTKTES